MQENIKKVQYMTLANSGTVQDHISWKLCASQEMYIKIVLAISKACMHNSNRLIRNENLSQRDKKHILHYLLK